MKAIGFTNKYYTLWEIWEEHRPLGNGRSYVITHYNYIKNISFDRETAISKYPELPIDETLRGHTRSWNSTKEVWDNVDTFRRGTGKTLTPTIRNSWRRYLLIEDTKYGKELTTIQQEIP